MTSILEVRPWNYNNLVSTIQKQFRDVPSSVTFFMYNNVLIVDNETIFVGLWIRIFSLLNTDPDLTGKNLRKKQEKIDRHW